MNCTTTTVTTVDIHGSTRKIMYDADSPEQVEIIRQIKLIAKLLREQSREPQQTAVLIDASLPDYKEENIENLRKQLSDIIGEEISTAAVVGAFVDNYSHVQGDVVVRTSSTHVHLDVYP